MISVKLKFKEEKFIFLQPRQTASFITLFQRCLSFLEQIRLAGIEEKFSPLSPVASSTGFSLFGWLREGWGVLQSHGPGVSGGGVKRRVSQHAVSSQREGEHPPLPPHSCLLLLLCDVLPFSLSLLPAPAVPALEARTPAAEAEHLPKSLILDWLV